MRIALTAALLAILVQSSPGQSDRVNQPPRDVSLLELRKNSAAYDNSLVRVRGELRNDEIGIWDPKTGHCLVAILLEFKDEFDIAKEYRPFHIEKFMALVKSGELQRTTTEVPWLVPLPIEPVSADQLEAVHKFWKKRDYRGVGSVVVGRFDYTKWGRLVMLRNGTISFIGGFGPQPQSGDRIVVESIIFQKKTK